MNIEFESSRLTDCKYGHLNASLDARGEFTKLLQISEIKKIYPKFEVAESYITKSQPGVLRGMHLQLPPHDHEKIVICLEGHVLDVVLELRNNENYGNHDSVTLSSRSQNFISIPKGVAHGFYAYEFSTLLYLVSTEHAPEHDTGISWNSFDYTWPTENPILSARDQNLQELKQFKTPF